MVISQAFRRSFRSEVGILYLSGENEYIMSKIIAFCFSEEIMSRVNRSMTIKVRDRATLFNLLVGLNGYTICTGIISAELNGGNIISRPLAVDEYIRVGTVTRRGVNLTKLGEEYINALHAHI